MRNEIASFATDEMDSTTFTGDIESDTALGDDTETVTTMDVSYVNVPNPDNAHALEVKVTPKHRVIGISSEMSSTLVCVNMKARDLPEDDNERAPVDVVVALDCSGSMNGNKLELCKKTLSFLLRVLYPGDRFGLITYADTARVDLPVQKMTPENKKKCAQVIGALRTRGSTNISAAIGLAYQELSQIDVPNSVQTVFLLTDGYANQGISNATQLVELTKNCFGSKDDLTLLGTEGAEEQVSSWHPFQRRGLNSATTAASPHSSVGHDESKDNATTNPITLHCFGYGKTHNSLLLRDMSSVVPGGSYYFVENDVDVGTAFGDAMGGILSVVAQNVAVNIRVDEDAKNVGVEILEVYHSEKFKRENGSFTVNVGDFYAEESRDVLLEVKLARGTDEAFQNPFPHGTITVSYTDTLKKTPVTTRPFGCAISRPRGSELSESDQHVEAQWLRIEATKAMEEANNMARNNNYGAAQNVLRSIRAKTLGASAAPKFAGTDDYTMLISLATDFGEMEREFASEDMYVTRGGMHKAANWGKTYTHQRCMASASQKVEKSSPLFQGKRKKKLSKAFGSLGKQSEDK